jgi:AcrR family transcriptional regulator
MGGSTTSFRQRRRADTKRAIVDAAMARLGAQGLEGLTMRRLARDLGCTEPALYRYFASKDALLAALTREVVDRLGALLERADAAARQRASEGALALVRVVLGAEVYAAVMRERAGEAALLTLVLGDPRYLVDRDASAPTVEAVGRLLGRVERWVLAAQEAGALEAGDARARSVRLWTAAHGAAQLRKFDRFGVPHLQVARVRHGFLSDLLRAWGADPSAVAAALEAADAAARLVVSEPLLLESPEE